MFTCFILAREKIRHLYRWKVGELVLANKGTCISVAQYWLGEIQSLVTMREVTFSTKVQAQIRPNHLFKSVPPSAYIPCDAVSVGSAEMIKNRVSFRLSYLLNALVRCTKRSFSDYLQLNNLSGTYEFSRAEKTLTLKVGQSVYDVQYGFRHTINYDRCKLFT